MSSQSISSAARAPSRWTIVLLVGLLCLIWGSTWAGIAVGLDSLPPFTSAAARFALAALVMTAVAPRLARAEGGARPPFGLSLWVGLTNFALSYAIVYWSETRLPSGVVCVLWAVYPLMMAVAARLFLGGEALGMRQVLGFASAFVGVVLLFATEIASLGPGKVPAAAVLLLSPLACTVGTTILKRSGGGVSSALVNRDGLWIGALVLGALALLADRGKPAVWDARAIGSLVYLAIAGTVVAFGLYFWLLRHTTASRLSVIAYVTPVIAIALGSAVRGEPVTGWILSGTATILLGVALVVAPARRAGASAARRAVPGASPSARLSRRAPAPGRARAGSRRGRGTSAGGPSRGS